MSAVTIGFSVVGNVSQEVEMLDSAIFPEQLVDGLNNGKYLTTIQEDG